MILKTEPAYIGRAKSLIAGGFALMAFVCALAIGTASAPALGGISWLMVTAGSAGLVYVVGAAMVTALVDLRTHGVPRGRLVMLPSARTLRPATVTTRGGRTRSTGR